MGYKNGNDNSQESYNESSDKSSRQRTSMTEKCCKETSKCQYERLSHTEKMEGE